MLESRGWSTGEWRSGGIEAERAIERAEVHGPGKPAAAQRELSITGVPTQLHTLFILRMNINEGLLKYSHSSPHMQQPPGCSVGPHRLHAQLLVLSQTCLVWRAKNQLAVHCLPLGSPTKLLLSSVHVSLCLHLLKRANGTPLFFSSSVFKCLLHHHSALSAHVL